MKKVNKQLLKLVMILSLVAGVSLVGNVMTTYLFASNEKFIPSDFDETLVEYFPDVFDKPKQQKLFINCMLNERKTKPRKRWVFSLASCVLSVDEQVYEAFEAN